MEKQPTKPSDPWPVPDQALRAGVVRSPGAVPRLPSGPVTIVDRGGAVLDQVKVYLIFWGGVWSTFGMTLFADAVITAVESMIKPYMAGLKQYRGIQPGSLVGAKIVSSSDPPNPYTDKDVENLISTLIIQGIAPQPDPQLFYCVMLPQGAVYEKNVKDNKDGKDGKDEKEAKDKREASEVLPQAVSPEAPASSPSETNPELAGLSQALDSLRQRVTIIEERLAQGKSFIQPQERPSVGDQALRPGTPTPGDLLGIVGIHNSFTLTSAPGKPLVRWGWVSNDGTLDWMTRVFSHELAEACTDPDPFSGFVVTSGCPDGGGTCEIGDLCEQSFVRLNGVLVQQYWSQQDGACAVPGKDSKDNKDNKESKDQKDGKDNKEQKEAKDQKDSSDHKNTKDHKDNKDDRDSPFGGVKTQVGPASLAAALAHGLDVLTNRVSAIERLVQEQGIGAPGPQEGASDADAKPGPASKGKRGARKRR